MLRTAILTFLMAMVPIIELRGAIPFGLTGGLPLWLSVLLSILGNMVPVPFILRFIRGIFFFMRVRLPKLSRIVHSMEKRAERKGKTLQKYGLIGLFLLVVIPFPGTGAWTGSLVAAFFNLEEKKALPVIFAAVCVAAAIVTLITEGVLNAL